MNAVVEQFPLLLASLQGMEQEMEAQQATFGTFNLAAEKVAENLDENSPGVADIQDKMEEFNERWNKITTEVSNRITLVSHFATNKYEIQLERLGLACEQALSRGAGERAGSPLSPPAPRERACSQARVGSNCLGICQMILVLGDYFI